MIYSFFKQIDKWGAWLFGWGANHTISAECGAGKKACLFCRIVCGLIHKFIDKNHCAEAAKNEQLTSEA